MKARSVAPTTAGAAAVFWLVTVNALQGINAQGVATVLTLGVVALTVFDGHSARFDAGAEAAGGSSSLPVAAWLFVAYESLRLLFHIDFNGLQNVIVHAGFFLTIAATANRTSVTAGKMWLSRIRLAALMATAIFAVTVFLEKPEAVYSARAFAMVALVGLCASVALANQRGNGRSIPFLLVAGIALSLSRAALVVGWLLLVFLSMRKPNAGALVKSAMSLLVLGVGALWTVWNFAPLRARFESNDNVSFYGIEVGTSGRAQIWEVVWRHIQLEPWFGWGPGSAQDLVTRYFGERIGHPHSEYLRILHDYGVLGLTLLLLAMSQLLLRSLRKWRRSESHEATQIHQSAFMAILSLALMSITSNITVFVFVMLPMAVLIGLSIGLPEGERQSVRKQRTPGTSLPEALYQKGAKPREGHPARRTERDHSFGEPIPGPVRWR